MAKSYRAYAPFDVAMKLLKPTTTMVKGVAKKVYPEPQSVEDVLFGSFRTFGGTEQYSNEVYTILATATVDTWFNPEIKADCQIYLCDTGETYQIISQPENIDVRHQYMQFKVEKVGGKA
jgi:hypothetical protein